MYQLDLSMESHSIKEFCFSLLVVEDRKEWRKTISSAAKFQEQWEQTKIDTSNERKQAKK